MPDRYFHLFVESSTGYGKFLIREIARPSFHNYFYWLLSLSAAAWALEILFPWRKGQPIVRKDFWLDGFYMFFNFFIFPLIGFYALSKVAAQAFTDLLGAFGIRNPVAVDIKAWPVWAQLTVMFLAADLIAWNVHRLLHKNAFLWRFHQVHHSVIQMGFAAHLRFHWMENVVYRTLQYVPLAMIGFGLKDFFVLHILTTAIGHLNHSNTKITYGPCKYLINNPAMHIWHHAGEYPAGRHGVNFGISLAVWDYLFKTAYIPGDGKDVPLGFASVETYPRGFFRQLAAPFGKKRDQ